MLLYSATSERAALKVECFECERYGDRGSPPGKKKADCQPKPLWVWTPTEQRACQADPGRDGAHEGEGGLLEGRETGVTGALTG